MTRHAREAISLAITTALVETVLQVLVTTDWSAVGAQALLFAFLNGPPLFLALTAWRRREHRARSRLLFIVAVLAAVGGIGALGVSLYRFSTDAEFRKTPNMTGVIVPLVQWGVIAVVWLYLVIQEGREKRAAREAAQSSQSAPSVPAPKPPQST